MFYVNVVNAGCYGPLPSVRHFRIEYRLVRVSGEFRGIEFLTGVEGVVRGCDVMACGGGTCAWRFIVREVGFIGLCTAVS